MRLTFAAAIAASLIAAPVLSTASADTMKNCSANWKAMSAADKAKTTYKDYSAACLKGGATTSAKTAAPAPAAAPAPVAKAAAPTKSSATAMKAAGGPAPAGATGQCKDGSYTMSKTHSGACSRHGGVAKWL